MDRILEGAIDMHVHAGPDVIPRRMDDLELAEACRKAGMRGFVIKCHNFDTAGRAYLVRKLYPDLQAIGSIVLNNSVGGLNPEAVRQAAKYGARLVFMPTLDAANMHTWKLRRELYDVNGAATAGVTDGAGTTNLTVAAQKLSAANALAKQRGAISVLEEDGSDQGRDNETGSRLAAPVEEILDIILENDMVLCSGHISPPETIALFERAKEKGICKMIATHVEWPPTKASTEELKKIVACGAYLEHCVINILGGDLSVEELIEQVREIGAEHMILSTDLGQTFNPSPVEAFEQYAGLLLEKGLTGDELKAMTVSNPKALVG